MSKPFGTLEKVVDILCLFDPKHQELSAQEISDYISMPLSTTYRYLQVFLNKQILTKDARTSKFRLGLTILRLGLLAAENNSVIEIAAPHLRSLNERTMETTFLTVLDGLDLVCVDVVESPRTIKITTGKGGVLPLYAGSPGKVVLAYKDDRFIERLIEARGLEKLNKNTITNLEDLKSELALIRSRGFSESDSEFESEVCSLAAPIFDHRGSVIASISVAGMGTRILGEGKEQLIEMVKEGARSISSGLGYGKG